MMAIPYMLGFQMFFSLQSLAQFSPFETVSKDDASGDTVGDKSFSLSENNVLRFIIGTRSSRLQKNDLLARGRIDFSCIFNEIIASTCVEHSSMNHQGAVHLYFCIEYFCLSMTL